MERPSEKLPAVRHRLNDGDRPGGASHRTQNNARPARVKRAHPASGAHSRSATCQLLTRRVGTVSRAAGADAELAR